MTVISNNQIARAIYLFSKDKSSAEQPLVFNKIIQFLVRERLLSKASNIILQLERIINQEENRMAVQVSSAEKLEEKTKEHLKQNLKRIYSKKNVREVMFIEKLDKDLLGGMRLETNDEVI